MADHLFDRADANRDRRLDLSEFRNLLAQSMGDGGQFSASSYESSASGTYGNVGGVGGHYEGAGHGHHGGGVGGHYEGHNHGHHEGGVGGHYGDGAQSAGVTMNGVGAFGGEGNYSSYGQSSYTSASGISANGFDVNASTGGAPSGFGNAGFESHGSSGMNFGSEIGGVSSFSTAERSSSHQQVHLNGSNPQNLYQDPNPQVIRRPAQGGQLTYTQNIKIRFLQPPPVPPPGPLIIREVRPPQPPPLPPLRIRQQAVGLPQPPPLILRERPPVPPASVASQTVVRQLPALPAPPRSVIIERLPALPPKPRDIIIERWLPYGAQAKRKTVVQRAATAKQYARPRNIIIQYEPVSVRVQRQFQRLGITPENPLAYTQRYGASLLEAQVLVQQARAAGVTEDISPPNNLATTAATSTSFNAGFSAAGSGIDTTGGVGFTAGGGQHGNASFSGSESGQGGGFSSNSFFDHGAGFSGSESEQGAGFSSNSFSGQGAGFSSNAFSSHVGDASFGGANGHSSDPTVAAFHAADLDGDGGLDPNEFRRFLSSQLQYRQ